MKYSKYLLFAFLTLSLTLSAQYKLNENLSNMYIDGTSSLHDWTETVGQIKGEVKADIEDGKITKIYSADVTIPVKSIKSGKSGMDKNTYKALKAEAHPNIIYKLKTYKLSKGKIYFTGDLTIAGTTNLVIFNATYEIKSKLLEIEGKYTFKMSDFNIKPPTAMMGTIKTGDEITIRFNLVFDYL